MNKSADRSIVECIDWRYQTVSVASFMLMWEFLRWGPLPSMRGHTGYRLDAPVQSTSQPHHYHKGREDCGSDPLCAGFQDGPELSNETIKVHADRTISAQLEALTTR